MSKYSDPKIHYTQTHKYIETGSDDDDGYANSNISNSSIIHADNRRSYENITKSVYKSNK